MMFFTVFVAAMAAVSVEAGVMKQEQQLQQLQLDHDDVDWRPHLPASFRTGFSRPIDNSPLVENSQIIFTNEEVLKKPVKSGEKKEAYIQNASEKASSQQHHRRSKRFLLPKQKYRVVAVPLSVFNFLGFLPVRIPGLPFHNDLPSPDYNPYRTTHEVPLRVRRRRLQHKKY